MRVIGGTARGRRLFCTGGRDTRPTPDRVRGSLFDILGQAFSGETVLDLFAGTGALSIEALSRGASCAVLVESAAAAARVIRRNIEAAGFADRVTVYEMNVERAVPIVARGGAGFDLVFAGPPYAYEREALLMEDLSRLGLLAPGGTAVFQHSSRRRLPDAAGGWCRFDRRTFGGTSLSFYSSDTLRRCH
ncbi:MAG: 16S rRNA (guanine(966)-N(2))-methyltransferase RsmD [Deltaproteobacteria bacterium]|nr:16S rRNA (guanine(966)-N(2))-methyltransferase RsmD [Deltaproteobacteria bacterium]